MLNDNNCYVSVYRDKIPGIIRETCTRNTHTSTVTTCCKGIRGCVCVVDVCPLGKYLIISTSFVFILFVRLRIPLFSCVCVLVPKTQKALTFLLHTLV